MEDFPFLPVQASSYAGRVDLLFFALTAISLFFTVAICVALLVFSIRYRKGTKVNRKLVAPDHTALELSWTIIPTIMALAVFFWAAYEFFLMQTPPANSMEIFVTGKQWMWKIQHPNGKREINELHVPKGQNVKLTMTSEDTIHSFFLPAFRTKKDVLPGRYTTQWFNPTKAGTYHLFCAEYCGTEHSKMVGKVIVMEPEEYQAWLTEDIVQPTAPGSSGERLFSRMGCATCHSPASGARGPHLAGIFGKEVRLQSGETVTVNEEYIRESILHPTAKLVAGYAALMPTFRNQLNQEEIYSLISYLKTLEAPEESSNS